jgi:hypothetical protein
MRRAGSSAGDPKDRPAACADLQLLLLRRPLQAATAHAHIRILEERDSLDRGAGGLTVRGVPCARVGVAERTLNGLRLRQRLRNGGARSASRAATAAR